jgi:hypothetical protein
VQLLLGYAEHPADLAPRKAARASRSNRVSVSGAGTSEIVARSRKLSPARTTENVIDHVVRFVVLDCSFLGTIEFVEDGLANRH